MRLGIAILCSRDVGDGVPSGCSLPAAFRDAWLTKVTALHKLGRNADALEDMETLMRCHGSDTKVQHYYEKAKFEVRKEKRTDYYEVLGVCGGPGAWGGGRWGGGTFLSSSMQLNAEVA